MSQALTLARRATTWADAIGKAATELATGGAILPGYRLQERQGRREVRDLAAAYARVGLSPERYPYRRYP